MQTGKVTSKGKVTSSTGQMDTVSLKRKAEEEGAIFFETQVPDEADLVPDVSGVDCDSIWNQAQDMNKYL